MEDRWIYEPLERKRKGRGRGSKCKKASLPRFPKRKPCHSSRTFLLYSAEKVDGKEIEEPLYDPTMA